MVRRYSRAPSKILAGVLRSRRSGLAISRQTTVRKAPTARHSQTDMATAWRIFVVFPSPKYWEMGMANPWVSACTTHSASQYDQSAAPTEASASTPIPFPTIIASTII